MRLKEYIPVSLRRAIGRSRQSVKDLLRLSSSDPAEIVKSNTREAFEAFWSHDDYINQQFLTQDRLEFFDTVADYCAETLLAQDVEVTIRIADIGCGTGHMLETLSHKLAPEYDIELFGLDFASTAIRKARILLPEGTFVVGDIYENSLPSDFFDIVLCIETLEHLRWPTRAVSQLLRVCKAEGSVVITVPNGDKDAWDGHVNYWSMSQFSKLLSPFGLVDMRLLRLWQEDMIIMARLAKCRSDTK